MEKNSQLRKAQLNVIEAWWNGTWALGWRGHLAMWLLMPILNETIAQNVETFYSAPKQ